MAVPVVIRVRGLLGLLAEMHRILLLMFLRFRGRRCPLGFMLVRIGNTRALANAVYHSLFLLDGLIGAPIETLNRKATSANISDIMDS
ncbi:MAG: hypothetical protein LAP38_22860 [Acidobacteriia bacterium]|nr:hypothetical protein [Terriglobia bacterium]